MEITEQEVLHMTNLKSGDRVVLPVALPEAAAFWGTIRRGKVILIFGVCPVDYDDFKCGQIFDADITIKAGQYNVYMTIDELPDHVETDVMSRIPL